MADDLSEREILTVPEVAKYLRVAPKTVYVLIQRGDLPSFRVGRVLRCHRGDVLRFTESRHKPTFLVGNRT